MLIFLLLLFWMVWQQTSSNIEYSCRGEDIKYLELHEVSETDVYVIDWSCFHKRKSKKIYVSAYSLDSTCWICKFCLIHNMDSLTYFIYCHMYVSVSWKINSSCYYWVGTHEYLRQCWYILYVIYKAVTIVSNHNKIFFLWNEFWNVIAWFWTFLLTQ